MNFPQLDFVRRMVELNSRTLWCAFVLGVALLTNGCITATEFLYSDPVFSTALKEFDRLHAQGELPGLPSDQKPRLSAYQMSEDYMRRDYYRLWREVSRGCANAQAVVHHKETGDSYAYFLCLDGENPKFIGTLYREHRKASWQKVR
jgi:hypothetical protein